MRYLLNKDTKPELILVANNVDLYERWVLRNAGYFMRNESGNSVYAFANTKPEDKKLQKTALALCEDTILERTVLAKTVCYEDRDLNDEKAIMARRRALAAQVDILNQVKSNMLPEPLDFFYVENDFDSFTCKDAKTYQEKEPVLILDYIPGEILADKLLSEKDISFYRAEDKAIFLKKPETINVGMIMRLVGDIFAFMIELYEKGYAYTSLSPDHIVILGDNKPRFVGVGRICPVAFDNYDCGHINYGRFLKGYSAPEFNVKSTDFGLQSSVKANMAYNFGVLLANILLGRSVVPDKLLVNGAYDYNNALDDRELIKKAWHGWMLDSFISQLTEMDPSKRMTKFESIMNELAIISGDAARETKKECPQLHYGRISFFNYEKGYGFVTDNATYKDYYVSLSRAKNVPIGYKGKPVIFTIEKDRKGDDVVKEFYEETPKPPRTDVQYPRFIKKPDPVVQPVKPKPQPKPSPSPQPQPQPSPSPQPQPEQPKKKKGLFGWLFG